MVFQPETSVFALPETLGHRNQSLTVSPGERTRQKKINKRRAVQKVQSITFVNLYNLMLVK